MKKLIASLLILSFLPLQGFAAFTNSDRAEFTGRNLLADHNPGAENGKAGWTVSSGSFTASTSSPLEGGASFVWDATATSQTFTGTAVTIPEGWKGQNGVISCRFQCASGTCTHTLTAWDGSNNVITPVTITSATTGSPRTSVNFTFPTTGTIAPRVTSAADEPSLKTDSCIIGLASDINLSQVNQASLVGTASFANTGSCTWSRTNTALGEPGTTAACPGPTVETNVGPGTIQTTDSDLPRVTVNSLPPGTYWVSYDGTASIATSAQEGAMAINDGTTTFGTTGMQWAVGGSHFHVEGAVTYTATANVTFKLYLSSGANAVSISNNGNNEATHFSIMRFPSTAEMAYRPEIYNWRVDANISGANPTLGTVAVSTYSGIEDASLTLTNNTSTTANILTAQIPCHTTTAPTGTTCSGVAESVGVSFVLPAAGDVEACADFINETDVGTAGAVGSIFTAFEIVETPNNAQTISQEGRGRAGGGLQTVNPAGGSRTVSDYPNHTCGTFSFTSSGQKTLRLFYEQSVSGTVSASLINADASASVGQRDIHWTVRPLTQTTPAPVFVGSVTSTSTGQERIERATINVSGAATASIVSQSGSWISSVSAASSVATVNITAGEWSSAPSCNCTPHGLITDGEFCRMNSSPTTSVLTFYVEVSTTAKNDKIDIICMGPR